MTQGADHEVLTDDAACESTDAGDGLSLAGRVVLLIACQNQDADRRQSIAEAARAVLLDDAPLRETARHAGLHPEQLRRIVERARGSLRGLVECGVPVPGLVATHPCSSS